MTHVKLEVSDSPDSSVLAEFYEGYDRAFVLPDEKEPLQGFRDCLALNHAPHYGPLASRYGAFREVVFTVTAAGDGTKVGGGNFLVLSHHCPSVDARPRYRTIHLNYIYVLPSQRRRGHMDAILSAIAGIASDALPLARDVDTYIFIEQNDPMKMSPAAYAEDTAHSGIDQVSRIGLWARRGARVVDVDYAQPPLSATQNPDRSLTLCVLRPDLHEMEACIVRDHLRAFFGISVLKGRVDPYSEPTAQEQLARLDEQCASNMRIAVLDPTAWAAAAGVDFGPGVRREPSTDGLRGHLRASSKAS